MNTIDCLTRIAHRDPNRSEATLQAEIRQLILQAPFSLSEEQVVIADLETRVGTRRRIDIEVGSCLIEVKRNLRAGNTLDEAIDQIGGYLEIRQSTTGFRYVGIVTDGSDWHCISLPVGPQTGVPHIVSSYKLASVNTEQESFLTWLEGVLATARNVPATPLEIHRRLGAASSSYLLDRDTLRDLFLRYRQHPAVLMKRQLWARLLTTALGTQFDDSDELFVEHTYLVNTAEIIAHALVGFELSTIVPASLLSGSKFEESGIAGVVEADFFDWVAFVPGGEAFVRSLVRRVGRFQWQEVGSDVLKVLYESVITAPTRKRLGEYYTPDWLAERIIDEVVNNPLETSILDPACGSGTFLFHAARKYLNAAEAANVSIAEALSGLTRNVTGMDLHPVAVTLARVTYLLAIGRQRLTHPDRPSIQIPVYLGDSIQWKREEGSLFSAGNLVVGVKDETELVESQLKFPESLMRDPTQFNQVVESLTKLASDRQVGAPVPKLSGLFQRFAIKNEEKETLETTLKALCELHDQGRDHIWSYYVRNLARPSWLSQAENRVDLLIGNPPWLAYRFMTSAMQKAFRQYSEERGLWHGAKVATHQDLSALFLVRSIERYLRKDGRFAFIMPNAVVDRGQFAGLRTGNYLPPDRHDPILVEFDESWDLRRIRPHFFPRGAAVVSGKLSYRSASLPTRTIIWKGRVPQENCAWKEVKSSLVQEYGEARPVDGEPTSPWADRFRQGATIVPRLLFFVLRQPKSPLGMASGHDQVKSLQRANDKKPWKDLAPLEGVVETEFLKPVLFGESIIPFRISRTFEAIIPKDTSGLLESGSERIQLYEGLARWMRAAENLWKKYRSSERLSLLEQINYQNKLLNQFPLQAQRIVYNTSGMHLAAARLNNARVIIDSSVYWATTRSEEEALYLCAILNSAKITELVRPLMSYGKDERHFHKHIWQLPMPEFDSSDDIHQALAQRGRQLETAVGNLQIDETRHFTAVRRTIREFIAATDVGQEIEELVVELLS